ncbi:MAG: hypothetical protein OXG24_09135 [Gammaproteobacteria bacterium]|nr:hypothetical protein [Gammaproteobacteria bacterium]
MALSITADEPENYIESDDYECIKQRMPVNKVQTKSFATLDSKRIDVYLCLNKESLDTELGVTRFDKGRVGEIDWLSDDLVPTTEHLYDVHCSDDWRTVHTVWIDSNSEQTLYEDHHTELVLDHHILGKYFKRVRKLESFDLGSCKEREEQKEKEAGTQQSST